MKALRIYLTLKTSALFTGVANGEENSSRTLPYIPGATLRGLLVGRYIETHKEIKDLMEDEAARKLFFGSLYFLNAYPICDQASGRSLPTPASWRKQKNEAMDGADGMDFALTVAEDFETPVRLPFTGVGENNFTVFSPDEQLTTHIGAEERGRVKKGNNSVFQYQALAQDQSFVAVIASEDDIDLKPIIDLLEQDKDLRLGRSHSASYGLVHVDKIQTDLNWHEYEENEDKDRTIITLLSDALLRDENGQPTLDLDAYLGNQLGRKISHKKAFVNSTVTGGFNRKWKLPLAQFPALSMGSVFVYDSSMLSKADLKSIETKGIGERRSEGYGRIAVNKETKDEFTLHSKDEISRIGSGNNKLSPESDALAKKMAERLLRKKLDGMLAAQAQRYEIKGNITNHQLSRLRGVLRASIAQHGSDPSKVQHFLADLKSIALEQYEKPRMPDGQKLKPWLDERLVENDGLRKLGFSDSDVPVVAGNKPDVEALHSEYTLRFIEAVINNHMKAKE